MKSGERTPRSDVDRISQTTDQLKSASVDGATTAPFPTIREIRGIRNWLKYSIDNDADDLSTVDKERVMMREILSSELLLLSSGTKRIHRLTSRVSLREPHGVRVTLWF